MKRLHFKLFFTTNYNYMQSLPSEGSENDARLDILDNMNV